MCQRRRATISHEEFLSVLKRLGPIDGLTIEGTAEQIRIFLGHRPWECEQCDEEGLFGGSQGVREEQVIEMG